MKQTERKKKWGAEVRPAAKKKVVQNQIKSLLLRAGYKLVNKSFYGEGGKVFLSDGFSHPGNILGRRSNDAPSRSHSELCDAPHLLCTIHKESRRINPGSSSETKVVSNWMVVAK